MVDMLEPKQFIYNFLNSVWLVENKQVHIKSIYLKIDVRGSRDDVAKESH